MYSLKTWKQEISTQMDLKSQEDDVCLICMQIYNEGLNDSDIRTLELHQNVFNKACKYLLSEIFEAALQWNFIKERSSPICQNCYSSVEKVSKLHEMVEKLEKTIQELVDSFTSEVLGHHNRLEELCKSGDDAFSDADELPRHIVTETVYEPDIDIDIKDEGGYSEDESRTNTSAIYATAIEDDEDSVGENFDSLIEEDADDKENSASNDTIFSSNISKQGTADSGVRSSNFAIQYAGLHLKQLRVTLTRLQMDSEVNISESVENRPRPKRKAALAATASLSKINKNSRSDKKWKLNLRSPERNISDTDWESDEETPSESGSDGLFENKIDKTNTVIVSRNKIARRPRIFEITKRFKCQSEFCNLSFNFTKELIAHSSESGHNNPKLYKCNRKNCSKGFFNKASLTIHVKFYHKKNRFGCKSCPKIFTQKRALRIHQYNSHVEKLLKCDNCENTFTRKINLSVHKKLHSGKYFECKSCHLKFLWRVSLKMHNRIEHNGDKQICNLCGKKCQSQLHLTRHRLIHFKSKINNVFHCAACKQIHFVENIWDSCIIENFRKETPTGFICAICTSVFEKGQDLDNHSKASGHVNKKLFQCDVCRKRYYKRCHLLCHKRGGCRRIKTIKTKPFKCTICLKGFGEKYSFKHHIEWHKNPDKFKCHDCGRRFSGKYPLQQHRKIHGDRKIYCCKLCKENFFQRRKLIEHSKDCLSRNRRAESTPLICKFCDNVFESEDKLKLHLKTHKGKMPCKFCGKILTRKALHKHLSTHSTENIFKCGKCEMSFNMKDKLQRHEISVHTDERPFVCTVCDAKFKSKEALTTHFLKHSTSNLCDICGKKFSRPVALNNHKKIHTGDFLKCTYDTCDRKFRVRTGLTEHIKFVHTKEIQYSCEVCPKSYSRKAALLQHMRTHTGERPFPCTQCDRAFTGKVSLKKHITSKHSETKLKCNLCEKMFSLKCKLQFHVRTIHGEKTFQCEFCPYLCRRSDYLATHIRENHTHTHGRPFVCEICGKGFKRKHNLGIHIKWHDKKKQIERDLTDIESESD